MVVERTRRTFTVDEYHRIGEAGIIGPDERVELLGGDIISMTPISPRHAAVVKRLARILIEQLGARAVVGIQDPIGLDDLSEPQPDVSVAKARDDYYAGAHPRPEDLLLVVEVADTTAFSDRHRQVPSYALGRIA